MNLRISFITIIILFCTVLSRNIKKSDQCGKYFCVPGHNYIGMAIDLVKDKQLDRNVLNFGYSNKIFRDNYRNITWGLADQVAAKYSGSGIETVHIFNRTLSYAEYLSRKTNARGRIGPWFSAGGSTKKVQEIVRNGTHAFVKVDQDIKVYELTLEDPIHFLIPSSLLNRTINYLPDNYNNSTKKIYRDYFIKYFGTHFITKVYLGGKASTETILTTSYISRYGESYSKIQAKAEFFFLRSKGEHERHHREHSQEWVKETKITTKIVGGNIGFRLKDFAKWAPTVALLPTAINYEVEYLPNIIKEYNKKKAFNIDLAIKDYLKDNGINDKPPNEIKNCTHLVLSDKIPRNAIERIGDSRVEFRTKCHPQKLAYLWRVRGPTDNDKCIVSWAFRFKRYNGNALFREINKAHSSKLEFWVGRSHQHFCSGDDDSQCTNIAINNRIFSDKWTTHGIIQIKPNTPIEINTDVYCCAAYCPFPDFRSFAVVYEPRLYYD